MRLLTSLVLFAALSYAGLQLKDLPAAVQKAVQENLKGGQIKNISKEVEKGVTQYEVESVLNGKRDFNIDSKGALVVTEEETTIGAIPAAAKEGIMKQVGTGKLGLVEILTRGNETLYEAAYTTKAGKKSEVMVKADGTVTK